jgi:AraC-like DNA-binding protein
MTFMKLFIKNMVCLRCKMVVKESLQKLGLHYFIVELGEVELKEDLSTEQYKQFRVALRKAGLELMDDKKSMLIEKIKNAIVDLVHYSDEQLRVNLSDYLSIKLHYDYTYLANLFSTVQGTTIEQFFIAHKIERVKELLVYNELNLTEIAYLMHYSSVAHLSTQFKKVTGLTPSRFKMLRNHKRIRLENV